MKQFNFNYIRRFFSSTPTPPSSSSSLKPWESLPGPPQIPTYGSFPDFQTRLNKADGVFGFAVNSYYKEYGNISRHQWGPTEKVAILFHPEDILEGYRQEGPYPSGLGSELVFTEWYKLRNKPSLSYVGPEWARLRKPVQKDMLSPIVAESYVPRLDQPTRLASQSIPFMSHSIDQFTPLVSNDMFFEVMLGYNPRSVLSVDPKHKHEVDPEDLLFIQAAMTALEVNGTISLDPTWPTNYKTNPDWPRLCDAMEHVSNRGKIYVDRALKNKPSEDNDQVRAYVYRLIERKEINVEEALALLSDFLFAGVDTTHHVLLWILFHLAKNPDKQEILFNELNQAIPGGKNGMITAEHIRLPYLNAVVRESHRMNPSVAIFSSRRFQSPIHIHGYSFPTNTRVLFDTYSIQNDTKYVDYVDQFLPERWLSDAVKGRKNSPKEILDHQLLKHPFSFGPRMCLGARVAEVEIKTFISRLVLDWKFEMEDKNPVYRINTKGMSRAIPFPKIQFNARS